MKTDSHTSRNSEGIAPIEELKPGEAVDLCNRVAAALHIAPGHAFQDRDAWEKVARALSKRFDSLGALPSEKAPIPPQVPSKPMPYPTQEEIALYRDTFRRELDKRMDTNHRSASPSTESHEIALRQFVENRNAP
jgi:hypothetical protein